MGWSYLIGALKVIGLTALVVFLYLFLGWPKTYPKTYGITWSANYARYLGIDSDQGLTAVLDELKIKHVRLPTYWTEGEKTPGTLDWSQVDKQLDLIEQHGGTVTLAIGAKQPRWPECWIPDWAKEKSAPERRAAQLNYVKNTIEHFKHRSSITQWQVENEPEFFSSFGDCIYYDKTTLADEIELVHALDEMHRPISTTASGELSTWLFEPKHLDIGFSVYRVVPNPIIKTIHYWFLPSWFYGRKISLRTMLRGGSMYVSELQMEPWVTNDILTSSIEEQGATLNLEQIKDNLLFARRLNVKRVDLWGAEWWYWMKTQKGHPEFWEEIKNSLK